jgi:hypothetical protein
MPPKHLDPENLWPARRHLPSIHPPCMSHCSTSNDQAAGRCHLCPPSYISGGPAPSTPPFPNKRSSHRYGQHSACLDQGWDTQARSLCRGSPSGASRAARNPLGCGVRFSWYSANHLYWGVEYRRIDTLE